MLYNSKKAKKIQCITHAHVHWLAKGIPAVLLPHSLCRFTTANAPANERSRATVTAKCSELRSLGLI